jgi:hypothetical protein
VGGSKKKTSTQTYRPPSWVEDASKQAIGIGQRIAGQEYEQYSGERIAPLSQNEQMGMQMARDTAGAAQPYYDEASALARRGSQQFSEADMADYMNPYIKNALDPAAREIREQGAREVSALEGRSASMGAFGGSRAALLQSEAREKTLQEVSDLYGEGYAKAYDSAVNIWGGERARDLMAAGRIQDLGTAVSSANRQDISTLMTTGATDRSVQQAMRDFDYQQFVENRDWDFRNLGGLIAALEGTKGSYTQTTTTEEKQSGGGVAQAIGLAATLLGAFFTGGTSLAVQGATGTLPGQEQT